MHNAPVHWYEGLFLRPHHFQAADRFWAETLRSSEQWDHPYNYGLLAIDFSREALGNQQFEVRLLKARMRDGTLVALEHGQEPDRVGLSEAFDKKEVLTVYLGIPKLKLGRLSLWKEVTAKNKRSGRRMSDAIFVAKNAKGRLAIGDKKEIDRAAWQKPRGIRLTPTSRYIRDRLFPRK